MYKQGLKLTNKSRCPLAVDNDFDDVFHLEDELIECNNADEFCKVANKYARYGKWYVDSDKQNETRLMHADVLGNVHYLIANKKSDTNLSSYRDMELINELKSRGYEVY